METWSYESLCFYVDKDGIESMTYSNPYTIGKIKTENLNLLSFSEVMKIYEKMMVVTNADNMQYENSRVYILIGSFLAMPEYMSRLLTHTQVF